MAGIFLITPPAMLALIYFLEKIIKNNPVLSVIIVLVIAFIFAVWAATYKNKYIQECDTAVSLKKTLDHYTTYTVLFSVKWNLHNQPCLQCEKPLTEGQTDIESFVSSYRAYLFYLS